MTCTISFSLLSESQTGTIGNDWKYRIEAKIFGTRGNHALIGQGTIEVPKHRLDSGKTQVPPGPPETLVLPAGEAGQEILVDLRIKAEEVDLLQNDTAEITSSFKMTCPGAGQPAVVDEREVSLHVTEEPSQIGHAYFNLVYRVTLQTG